ncbi:MAG: o-succinylbenzoate synthase [Balneolaceae bacterium]
MISLYRYRLGFKQPFRTSGRSYPFREGVILRYTGRGSDIVSEIAPLPGFSEESLTEVIPLLASRRQELSAFLSSVNTPEQLLQTLKRTRYPPSVQFGISCLALHLVSSVKTGTAESLPPAGPAKKLRVNGVIGLGRDEDIRAAVHSLYRNGYRTIKFKCGPDPGTLPAILGEAAEQYPELTFRLDPNRCWPLEKAPGFLEKFSRLPVEYCEEPCFFEHLSQCAELKKRSAVPIALDESVRTADMIRLIASTGAADTVILKPMLLGNIRELIETSFKKETHSINRVCTTSLESGIGRFSVAQLASRIGSGHLAHGLDTGRLFRHDLYNTEITGGSIDTGDGGTWCLPFNHCSMENLSKIKVL